MISSFLGIFSPRHAHAPMHGPPPEEEDDYEQDAGPETQAPRGTPDTGCTTNDGADGTPRGLGSDAESDDDGSRGPETQGPPGGGSTPGEGSMPLGRPGPCDTRVPSSRSQSRSTRQPEIDGVLGSGANNDGDHGTTARPAGAVEGEGGEDAALSSFFAHVSPRPSLSRGSSSRPGRGENKSYGEWRGDRKNALKAYLTRRLGPYDGHGDGGGYSEGGDGASPAGDFACSQSSDVHGRDFGEASSPATRAANPQNRREGDADDGVMDDGEEGRSEEETQLETQAPETQALETQPLETQPLETPQGDSNDGNALGGDDSSSDGDTGGGGGILGGLRRRLGFSGSKPKRKRPRESEPTRETKRRRLDPSEFHSSRANAARIPSRPGGMWDGAMSSVPCITEARRECTSISDADLSAKAVDLSTCRILRVWRKRDTKRMRRGRVGPEVAPTENDLPGGAADGGAPGPVPANGDAGSPDDSEEGSDYASAMVPFGRFEDDGPLDTVYRRVISLEIVQLDEDECQSAPSSSRNNGVENGGGEGSAKRRADELFPEGAEHIRLTSDRRRRHGRRRMKVFLYDGFADVVEGAIESLTSGRDGGKCPPRVLMSLEGVPPECVFPHRVGATEGAGDFRREEEARLNPFGDPDLGSLSSYCICIGDKSGMKADGVRVRFVGNETQLRLALAPTTRPQTGDDVTSDEMVVDVGTMRSGPKYRKNTAAVLMRRYCRLTWGDAPSDPIAPSSAADQSERQKDGTGDHVGDGRAAASNGQSNGSAGGPNGNPDGEDSVDPSGNPRNGDHAPASITRPPRLATLISLRARLNQGQTKADLYGIVLGFSSPRLTASNQHMMSIVLVDETLPLPSIENSFDVESVTLMIFSREPSGLPKVRSAGDVVYLEQIKVQEHNGKMQLAAFSNSKPVVSVARPAATPGGWTVSAKGGAPPPPRFDEALASRLYAWGQRRLSSHPTVSGRCAATLSCLNENATAGEAALASGGDLTVVVTGIVETPEGARTRDSPRGYLRVWDGTGPSRSDP